MAKRYTAEEIKQKNFKRITGMNQKEYGEKVARDQLAKQKTFETPKMEAPKYETASPDYKFTAEKPKAALNYNSMGVSSVANAEEYDRKKALYDEAVTEANKRAVLDIAEKERLGESLNGIPSLGTEKMMQTLRPVVETDQAKMLENYVSSKLKSEALPKSDIDLPENPADKNSVGLKKYDIQKLVDYAEENAEKIKREQEAKTPEKPTITPTMGAGVGAYSSNKTEADVIIENMTPKQLETYTYLLDYDPKTANVYIDSVKKDVESRVAEQEMKMYQYEAKRNPALGAAANISAGLMQSFTTPMLYTKNISNIIKGEEPVSSDSTWHQLGRVSQATQQGLTEGKSDAEAFLINTGLSIAQNLARLPTALAGGPSGAVVSKLVAASTAAGQTVYEATQRGATSMQSLLLGTVAGGLEYATESIGLDNLLKLGKDSVKILSKEAAQSIVKQMVSEGGEEMISEVGNIIADSIIMGDKAEMKQLYNSYLKSGMSEKDATLNVLFQSALNIGLAGLGGALSGGVLGAGGTVVGSTVNNISEGNNTGNVKQLISKAASTPEDSTAYKLSQRAKKKLDDGKRFNKYELGQLSNEIKIAEAEKIKAAKIEAEAKAKESTNTEAENKVAPTVETAETPIKTESSSTDKSETANGWVFEEKKEALPDSAKASERAAMFGANGQKGYITAVESIRKENPSADIESFTKAFEKAYIAGYSRTSESKYTSDPYLYKAYMNGYNDSKLDYSSDVKYIDTVGVTRVGENKGLVENELSSKLSNRAFSFWNKLAKDLDVKIEIVNELEGNKALAGSYRDGYIRINANSDKPINSLMAHEVVHRIKEISPEAYSTLKKQVVSALGESVVDEVQRIPLKYASVGEDISSVAKAEEEVVAEYTERLFGDEATAEKFIKENQSIAKRILEAIKGFIEKIRKAFGKGSTKELSDLEKLASSWDSAIKTAAKEVKTAKTTTESRPESYAVNKAVEEMSETELRQKVSELEEQNKNLSKIAYEGATVPGIDKVTKFSNELLKKYSSSYDSSKLASHINERLIEIDTGFDKNGKPLQSWELERNLKNTLRSMIDEAVEVDRERYEELADVRKNLRATKLRIRRIDSLDFGSAEDYNAFRMSNFGRVASLKVVDDNTDNIDSVYFSLNDKYGDELFPSDITAASDQLQIIMGIYDLAQVTERNVHEGMEDLALNNAVDDVWDFYMEHRHSPEGDTVADMRNREILKQRELRSYQNKQAQKMFVDLQKDARQYRKWLENKLTENSKKYKEQVDKETAETLKQSKEKLKSDLKDYSKIIRERYAEKNRIKNENKNKTAVAKSVDEAIRHLTRVGKKTSIKDINEYLENKFVAKLRAYNQDSKSATMEVLRDFLDSTIDENKESTIWQDDVLRYKYISPDGNREFNVDPKNSDEVIDELELIQRVLRDIQISKTEKLVEKATNLVDEVENSLDTETSKKIESKSFKMKYLGQFLSPYSFMRLISGYKGGTMESIYDMLETAENKSRLIRRQGLEQFEDLINDKNKFKDFKTRRIELKTGIDFTSRKLTDKIEITPDLLVALYTHSKNEHNMKSIEYDPKGMTGVLIPNIKKVNEGNFEDAWRHAEAINFTKEQIEAAYTKYLNAYDKAWAERYKKFADEWAKNLLNNASMDAYGTIVAPVDNYIHIRRAEGKAGSQSAQLFEDLNGLKTLKSSGSLKDRAVGAKSEIMLEPISVVIEQQRNLVSEYAGKVGALSRLEKLTRYEVDKIGADGVVEGTETFRSALKKVWGTFGTKYWNNLMADLNGNSRTSKGLLSTLRGKYSVARLGLNVTSIMVQNTAKFNAVAELGFDGIGTPKAKKLTLEDVAPYTARATDRAEGYINAELAEKYGAKSMYDQTSNAVMKLITMGDISAVKSILRQSQVYVEKHNPGMELNSKEYIEEVARVFERVVNRTQTGSTAMLKAEVFRGDDFVMRLLSFMGSESIKNGNIMFDGAMNLITKKNAYKKNKTAENKKALDEAAAEFNRKFGSVVLTNAVAAAFVALGRVLFKGQWDKYLDDDDELGLSPLGHASMKVLSDFMQSMADSFIGGGEVYSALSYIIGAGAKSIQYSLSDDPNKELNLAKDFTYDLGQSVPELEFILDIANDFGTLGGAVGDVVTERSDKNVEAAHRAAKNLGMSLATLGGVPASNVEQFIVGTAESMIRFVEKFIDKSVGLEARYELMKHKRNINVSSNRGAFYDLLYQAYLLDDRTAYRNIRRDLLEKGYTHQALDSAIDKRRKEDREKQRKK